jgi:leader peptidase (prepilin peptidase)/N-methyltransferase
MFNLFLFILGLSIGSFLNVLIDRLPKEEQITGWSYCDSCHHRLFMLDLIPVFSFLSLKRRCRYCRKKISIHYPLVEILTGVMFILTWNIIPGGYNIVKLAYLGVISCLIIVFFSDLKYHIIPDSVQMTLFIFSLFAVGKDINLIIFAGRIASALLIMAPILILHLLTHGNGMGFGDVKLAFIIGFLLGIRGGLVALYIAFIIGAVVGIIFIILGKKGLKSKIAFGPFLVLGILTMIFWQESFFALFRKIYGF